MSDYVFALPGLTLGFRNIVGGEFPVARSLAPFAADADLATGHEVIARLAGPQGLQQRGTTIWSGALIDGTEASISREGDALHFLVPGRMSATEQPGSRVTEVQFLPDIENPFRGMPALVLLDMAVRNHQLLMVHAATMLLPDRSGVVLLFAPSGSGKTTTSLILALAGYGHLGDDVAVLRKAEDGFRAWGMPRALKVHRRTAAMLPAVAPHLSEFDGEDEARLTPASLAEITPLPPTTEHPVNAIVVVGNRSEGTASVSRITKVEALSHIVADNVGMLGDGVPAHAQSLFAHLSQIVAATPSFRLDAGSDPTQIAAAFDAALGQARG